MNDSEHFLNGCVFMKKLNVDEMLQFLKKFAPVEFKYSMFSLYPESMSKISEYEDMFEFGSLSKRRFSYIADNIRLVYGDKKIVKDDIDLYHLTEKKIVHQFLAIPELDQMFDEDYFDFEWDMHVGQNFKEHKNDYYRDHFLHQVRNMYMMYVLLNEFGFYEASKKILSDKSISKISEYSYKKGKQFLADKHTSFWDLALKLNRSDDISLEDCIRNYFYKYIIYASAFLAALFHDMGYPICHFLEVRHRISEYNPSLYMFTHNAIESFDQLASKLGGSLLFSIVSPQEIKDRLQKINSIGKYDHGAYSAIAFLLRFYETGIIYSLSAEKQCAIELAAVAIYNHTSKYNCVKHKEENNYYQPIFRQNPISFLLKTCDDLQEWDRRYFEISDASDLLTCQICHAPFLPHSEKQSSYEQIDPRNIKRIYRCMCKKDEGAYEPCEPFKYQIFQKRKIFIVRTCDNLYFNLENKKSEGYGSKDKFELLKVTIDYDLYRLLEMARLNNNYASHRLNELNELKLLLKHQNFAYQSEDEIAFNFVYLDYFMTCNPLLIKVKILERYLNKKGGICAGKTSIGCLGLKSKLSTGLQGYLDNKALDFYKRLLDESIKCRDKDIDDPGFDKVTVINSIIDVLGVSDDKFYEDYRVTMEVLIEDCLRQYSRECSQCSIDYINSDRYMNQYEPKEKKVLSSYVLRYCNHENEYNWYENSNNYIGYFTDLHFFDILNRETITADT